MKSGYRYKNIPEYMYRRVINAAAYAMFAVFIGAYMFNFSVEILTILAVGAAIWGFRGPDISINNAIKARSEKLQMEMGYTLEQFLNLLDAGVGYEDALANCRGIGEFGAFLAKISEQLRLSDSTADAIKKASADSPIFPEMEQFLDLLKSHIIEQQDISTPLHAMALTLREKFNNDIKKKSGSARLRALVVLIGFGGAATLVIALMPLSKVIFR
jgi:Flp pilus assembly protein TadB